MIGLALLLALGLTLIGASTHLLDDRAPESKPDGIAWSDALILLLCLAGILAARKRERDESDE